MGFKKPSTEVTSFVQKPGWFHVFVTGIEVNPVYDGEVKDYVALRTVVLAGTEPSQVKHTATLRLNNPNEGNKDGGEFLFKVQCRAAIAMDIWAIAQNEQGEPQYFNIADVPEGVEMEIDWLGPDHQQDPENVPPYVIGKQFVVKLQEEEYQGKKSIKHDGAHFYHIGDPDVAHVPLDAKALAQGGYKLPEKVDAPAAAAQGAKSPAKNGGAKTPAKGPSTPGAPTAPAKSPAKSAVPAGAAAGSAANGAYDDL